MVFGAEVLMLSSKEAASVVSAKIASSYTGQIRD
jgi:hypothetical protein